jgi:hypothetical protein
VDLRLEVGALHPITGRQWQLEGEQEAVIWPDACLVVPFATQVNDATDTIVNSINGKGEEYASSVQGGWTVTSLLEALELLDLTPTPPVPVEGVTAVWAAGPGGDTPVLHVLGNDPFSWLAPHLDAAATAKTTVYPFLDQWFGHGPAEILTKPRRFAELVITPPTGATESSLPRLLAAPIPLLTRVLHAPGAQLSFSYPSGPTIGVEDVSLGVLVRGGELEVADIAAKTIPLPSPFDQLDWSFALIDLGEAGDAPLTISYAGSIVFVRYRHRPRTVTTPERITLVPGHYRLTLSGTTTAKPPPDLAKDGQKDLETPWSATRTFFVEHPPSLRPYVCSTTLGDDRLFGPKPGFDPTLPGVGFPAHTAYLPVVRFRVPYVKAMFPKLRLIVDYVEGKRIEQANIAVVENSTQETSLPQATIDWKTANGSTKIPYDDEVVMTTALVAGDASISLWHDPPVGNPFELDSWGVRISQFSNAAAHVAWAKTCITRWYRRNGPHDGPGCVPIGTVRTTEVTVGKGGVKVGRIAAPKPNEYNTPPADWALPQTLAALIEPPASVAGILATDASQRFLQFLWRSEVSLVKGTGPSLAGVADPEKTTTIEAVCDDQDRPLALWLRTPEPIDWRRIDAAMTLRHVEPDGGCPTSYANRKSMALTVALLPSTDGSGALLIARLGIVPTRLPRGEIKLDLTYATSVPGLVTLRRAGPLPSAPESTNLTFLQPLGKTWPRPSGPPSTKVKKPPKVYKKPTLPPGPRPLEVDEVLEVFERHLGRRRWR